MSFSYQFRQFETRNVRRPHYPTAAAQQSKNIKILYKKANKGAAIVELRFASRVDGCHDLE